MSALISVLCFAVGTRTAALLLVLFRHLHNIFSKPSIRLLNTFRFGALSVSLGRFTYLLGVNMSNLCLVTLNIWSCLSQQNPQDSYRSRKTGKCQRICVFREMSRKIFLKSQGKWSWIMQTADNCDFLHLQILKSRQICSFHWTSKSQSVSASGEASPPTPRPGPLSFAYCSINTVSLTGKVREFCCRKPVGTLNPLDILRCNIF